MTILQIGNESERLAALRSGSIDGSVFNAPFGVDGEEIQLQCFGGRRRVGDSLFQHRNVRQRQIDCRKTRGRILNFLRAYVEAIKIFKTEPEYTLKALAQFSRVNDQELLKEAYEYNKNKIPDIPYPSVSAMQAVVDPLVAAEPKLGKIDAKNFVSGSVFKETGRRGVRAEVDGAVGIASTDCAVVKPRPRWTCMSAAYEQRHLKDTFFRLGVGWRLYLLSIVRPAGFNIG